MIETYKYVVIDKALPEGKQIIYEFVSHYPRNMLYLKQVCPYCLHGWQHDVVMSIDEDGNENTADIECGRCDGTGFI